MISVTTPSLSAPRSRRQRPICITVLLSTTLLLLPTINGALVHLLLSTSAKRTQLESNPVDDDHCVLQLVHPPHQAVWRLDPGSVMTT